MQFQIRAVNNSENISCFELESNGSFLYAAIEANPIDPNAFSETSGFDILLAKSVERLPERYAIGEFPDLLADALERVITQHAKIYPRLFHVGYVGIGISGRRVYVSTAGNCRVHLLEQYNVLAVTRDHNLVDDPIDGFDSSEMGEELREYLRESESRQIAAVRGDERSLHRAEKLVWTAPDAYTVLVTSAAIHRFRPPDSYVCDVIRMSRGSDLRTVDRLGELITVIEVSH